MKTLMKPISCFILSLIVFNSACSTVGLKEGRVFLDSSTHQETPPDWVKSTKISWETENKLLFKTVHTVRGNERINGCFDLARLDVKENLLGEISSEIKGSLDTAQQSLSENAEVVLSKARSESFHGKITGLRVTEEYFDRYRIDDIERVDCYILAEIKLTDFNSLKRSILDEVFAVDSKLKDAIVQKQIDFFKVSSSKIQKPDTQNTKTQATQEQDQEQDEE